jgi:hypothetical protein
MWSNVMWLLERPETRVLPDLSVPPRPDRRKWATDLRVTLPIVAVAPATGCMITSDEYALDERRTFP